MSPHRSARPRTFLRRSALAALCLLALVLAALADPARAQQDSATVPDQVAEAAATRIEVDEQAGVIRFFVHGEEKARITENGVQVREDIEYGGTITDTGTAYYDVTDPSLAKDGEGRDEP